MKEAKETLGTMIKNLTFTLLAGQVPPQPSLEFHVGSEGKEQNKEIQGDPIGPQPTVWALEEKLPEKVTRKRKVNWMTGYS